MKSFQLIETEWPTFEAATPPPRAEARSFSARIDAVRSQMQGLSHLLVYGDREHFANITYLTGFDPRFEEALLVIRQGETPLLLVGNECEGYLDISPLYQAGELRTERYQPFSLINQPWDDSRTLHEIFSDEGMDASSRVGCIGWKYYDNRRDIEIPAYIVDTARRIVGFENVVNATALLMHPRDGLRARVTAEEIAYFEYTNTLASEGMRRMLTGLQVGMTDYEVAALAGINGEPLGAHLTLVTGDNRHLGLSSPFGGEVRRGEPLSTNLCYWGANSCRAGWVAESAADLPEAAKNYVEAFAGPYFAALGEWFSRLQIGTPGAALFDAIQDNLDDSFGITLNPGHLIHLDEWLSSPIYAGSDIPIESGMAIQVDVIPVSGAYFSTRMEDGVVIADEDLRNQLATNYPDAYRRIIKRRAFMTETLHIELADEVLPLSNIPGIVPPFFLQPNTIFALEG